MIVPSSDILTQEVTSWTGLTLLHAEMSSCSQKVRLLMREKGLDYISRPIDLAANEHTKPWYLGINARGVVPVLVHDGVVHIESNDILTYLDGLPSSAASFFPTNEAEQARVEASLALEDSLHTALRVVTMGFMLPARLTTKSDEVLARWEKEGATNPNRLKEVKWWRDFAEHKGVTPAQAQQAVAQYIAAFTTLDEELADQDWLLGDRLSVLDIAWFISAHRLVASGYPLHRHANLNAWYKRLLKRGSFRQETAGSAFITHFFVPLYTGIRRLLGASLGKVVRDMR